MDPNHSGPSLRHHRHPQDREDLGIDDDQRITALAARPAHALFRRRRYTTPGRTANASAGSRADLKATQQK
jgi:hypothetical protein